MKQSTPKPIEVKTDKEDVDRTSPRNSYKTTENEKQNKKLQSAKTVDVA